MHEATICKQGDYHTGGHDGTHLIEDWLVVFKTDLDTPMTQCSPSEGNGVTTIHEGGTDQMTDTHDLATIHDEDVA
jgi:hypothetical protein